MHAFDENACASKGNCYEIYEKKKKKRMGRKKNIVVRFVIFDTS